MEAVNTLIMNMKKSPTAMEDPKEISRVNYTTESSEVKLNYYALCICVLSERIPEEAFRILGVTGEPMRFKNTDVEDIWMLKKNHTWKQIGERYGTSADAIRRRVIRFQERQKIS